MRWNRISRDLTEFRGMELDLEDSREFELEVAGVSGRDPIAFGGIVLYVVGCNEHVWNLLHLVGGL